MKIISHNDGITEHIVVFPMADQEFEVWANAGLQADQGDADGISNATMRLVNGDEITIVSHTVLQIAGSRGVRITVDISGLNAAQTTAYRALFTENQIHPELARVGESANLYCGYAFQRRSTRYVDSKDRVKLYDRTIYSANQI